MAETRAKARKEKFIDPAQEENIIVVEDKSKRGRVARWAVLRSEGKSMKEIAESMNISPGTLATYIHQASQEGWLKIEDLTDRLEHVLSPKAVDNVEYFLTERDRTVTLDHLWGMGYYRTHQTVKGDGDHATSVLAIKIDLPPGTEIRQAGGRISGTPKTRDGVVVEAETIGDLQE